MPVENKVDYISDLDPKSPNGGESISEGDDHIRNIKKAIVETFPEIKGEVTVGHEKLNEVDAALPVAPSVNGSILHNKGNKWDETDVISIKDGAAYIPGFSGLGDLTLYVANNGQIMAAKRENNPALQHDLDGHTDVDYDRDLKEDDQLIFDGTKWVPQQRRSGNMFKAVQQPQIVGDFRADNGVWRAELQDGEAKTVKFPIPDGMRFSLAQIATTDGINGHTAIQLGSIEVDGEKPLLYEADNRYYQFSWPVYPEDNPGPNVEVVTEVKVNASGLYLQGGNTGDILIYGMFFEA